MQIILDDRLGKYGFVLHILTNSRHDVGVQSPVRRCQRHSRRSYLAAGEDAPWEYLCPITRELMVDPVTLSTGQTYDRAPITKWINDGHYTCPVTGNFSSLLKLLSQAS